MGQTSVHLACGDRGSTLAYMERDPYRLDHSPLLILYAVGGVLAVAFALVMRWDFEKAAAGAFYCVVGALLVVGALERRRRRRR